MRVAVAPVNAPALVAEQLGLEQARGNRAAVDDDERPVAPRALAGGSTRPRAPCRCRSRPGAARCASLLRRRLERANAARIAIDPPAQLAEPHRAPTAASSTSRAPTSKRSVVRPSESTAPARSGASITGTPSTSVPLRLPRSRTNDRPSTIRDLAVELRQRGSAITKSARGSAPITMRSAANGNRVRRARHR